MENIPDTQSLFDVSDKVALITGATGGFGQASSKGLAKAGAKVMLTGRTAEKLEPLAREIQEAGYTGAYVAGQPTDPDDVKHIVEETVKQFGSIDILITAAGLSRIHPITEFPLEEFEEVMDTNVKGSWLICREVGRVMIEQGRGGKVILVSDDDGIADAKAGAWSTIRMPHPHASVAPILYSVPAQLLAYHTAVAKGTDVDQPRNLAKSVTVE